MSTTAKSTRDTTLVYAGGGGSVGDGGDVHAESRRRRKRRRPDPVTFDALMGTDISTLVESVDGRDRGEANNEHRTRYESIKRAARHYSSM